jgi:type IV pilus assembly protein PilC
MPYFKWKGMGLNGKIQKGEREAESLENLKTLLLQDSVALLSAREIKQNAVSFIRFFKKEKNVSALQITFFQQLASLLKRGIELTAALELTKKYVRSNSFKSIIDSILKDVEQGEMFSVAIQKHKVFFTPFVVQVVAAGERAGKLDDVLSYLVSHLQLMSTAKQDIKRAALLPTITLFFSFALIIGIFIGVIPQFESLFQTAARELPLATQYILKISAFLQSYYFLFFIIFVIAAFVGIKFLFKTSHAVQLKKDKVILSLPGVGKLFLLFDLICFSRTLSVLLSSGVHITDALQQASGVIKSTFLQARARQLSGLVDKGLSLEEALKEIGIKYFPESMIAAVSVGEQTGNLADVLEQVAEFFSEELSLSLNTVTTLFQPILLLVVGFVVGFIMLAIYLPIFTMANVIY